MCLDNLCPDRGMCHRYCAWPDHWQSFGSFNRAADAPRCEHFEPRWPRDRTPAQADSSTSKSYTS